MTTKEYLEIYSKYPSYNKYKGWRKDLRRIKKFNKELTKKYPWLLPHNRWTGDGVEDYDYSYTELDNMPNGWRIAFGDQMCEEIHEELVKFKYVYEYRIMQIKEKYGGLRWYDNGGTKKLSDILLKYENLSYNYCINCGNPAEYISTGWISPYCSECARRSKVFDTDFEPIKKTEE